ncbi:FAD-binding protein [Nocardioides sp. LMS-CY]|uniref:FAD-binding protein n=1 Tax=Nocardioides sp. (strain LMS-CY) TaxID=2840457 RepID=UPI001C005BC7|nr:FAD-binding protein [Nocardioides sp. LMS-CY]QWF21292.1 FAD-binding protein [Nocardioides sp. LMS-CY]
MSASTVEPGLVTTDVLVIGGGAAGIYAALEARAAGAEVCLLDKSMVGVGGATIMAQMTVAAALGHREDDSAELHFADTIASGKELVSEPLAELMCEDAPRRILETRDMGVRWASDGDRLRQVIAPGHSRQRCCYVDVLATGTGVIKGMKLELRRRDVERTQNLYVTELIRDECGRVCGAAALDITDGRPVAIWAGSVVLACGGLTEMYSRNSASVNMTGDAYALALGVGAEILDPEMVQFFPIGNLAPRTIGLDPIMWDPFRYKLGGRLTNGLDEDFLERYAGVADEGKYTATRDVVSYAILKEVEAGRGSPHGGAWLDFRGIPAEDIHAAFPPVVDKLLEQGIDLTQRRVEVGPTAHYTIGGLRVDPQMRTNIPGLLAAGEAVGGVHGANRLSGNAISEAFVFGARAGVSAAADAVELGRPDPNGSAAAAMKDALGRIDEGRDRNRESGIFLPALRRRLQEVMWHRVGPLRDEAGLMAAEAELAELADAVELAHVAPDRTHNQEWVELFEMRTMLRNAAVIRLGALERRESRGAHQREDFVATDAAYVRNSVITDDGSGLVHRWEDIPRRSPATQEEVLGA